jgi:hypothetical protein
MTAGEINKTILANGGLDILSPISNPATTHSIGFFPSSTANWETMVGPNKPKKNIYGNSSRHAKNWIAGPTHEICLQHIPGYKGHIPGLISENLFAKSFAKCSQLSIGHRIPRGHDLTPKVRFRSQT